MKTSYVTKLGLVALALLLLVWLGLWLSSGASDKLGPAATEGHCPNCGRPLPKTTSGFGECPFCKLEEAKNGEAGSRQKKALASSPVIPVVLISLFCILLAVHVFVTVRSRLRGGSEEPSYPLFCPKCHRKLRYRHSQGGRLGQCPICKRPIAFPKPPEVRRPWHVRVWKKVMG